MSQNRIQIQLDFMANTQAARAELQNLSMLLQKLQGEGALAGVGTAAATELRQASQAATELDMHLKQAINAETGKLDLSKFNMSLKSTGANLGALASKMAAAGATGQEAFTSLAVAISQAEMPVMTLGARMDKLMTTFANTARWMLTSGILTGALSTIRGAYDYAKDLDQALNDIQIVSKLNTDEMAKFAVQANKAAQALSSTTVKYAEAALIYYQQGLSGDEVEKRTQATIKMANVTGQTAETVSDQLTAIWNNFAEGASNLEYYADVITALGAATASSSEEIATGLEKFAAVADTIGLSYEYAASAVATIVDQTRQSPEIVGTALKTTFARMEGLKLGETLDDGVTLNQYSEALAKIGVNILDINGELKDMDIILDEAGAKWQELSRAEQVATAQTVSGIRQYTAFMALMANYDKFKANVTLATDSEGELQAQQEIYEQSWKASINRVKAASEGLYNSLIDNEFFKGMNDTFAEILKGFTNITEAGGGFKVILEAIAAIFLNSIALKVTPMLQSLGLTFQHLTGNISNVYAQTQQSFQNTAQNIIQTMSLEGTYAEKVITSSGIIQGARAKAAMAAKNQSQAEQQMAQMGIFALETMQKEYLQLAQKVEETKTKVTEATSAFNEVKPVKFKMDTSQIDNKIKQLKDEIEKLESYDSTQAARALGSEVDKQSRGYKNIKKIDSRNAEIAELNQIKETSKQLSQAFTEDFDRMNESIVKACASGEDLDVVLENISNGSSFEQSLNSLNQLKKGLKDGTISTETARASLENLVNALIKAGVPAENLKDILEQLKSGKISINLINASIDSLVDQLLSGQIGIEQFKKSLKSLDPDQLKVLLEKFESMKNRTKEAELAMQELRKVLHNIQAGAKNLDLSHVATGAEIFSRFGSSLMSFSMVLNSFKSLWEGITNPDMSGWERATTIMMSLGMLIPGIVSGFQSYQFVISALYDKKVALNSIEVISAAVQAAEKEATENGTKADIEAVVTEEAKRIATEKGMSADGAAVIVKTYKTKTQKKETLGTKKDTVETEINTKARMKNLLVTGLWITAAVALVAVLGRLIYNWATAETTQEKLNKKLEKSREQLTKLKEGYTEAASKAQELKDTISNYDEAKTALSELTEGTTAWKEQIIKINEQAMKLLELYPELSKYSSMINGQITFESGKLEELYEKVLDKQKETFLLYQAGQSANAKNQAEVNKFNSESAVDKLKNFSTQEQTTYYVMNQAAAGRSGYSTKSEEDFKKLSSEEQKKWSERQGITKYSFGEVNLDILKDAMKQQQFNTNEELIEYLKKNPNFGQSSIKALESAMEQGVFDINKINADLIESQDALRKSNEDLLKSTYDDDDPTAGIKAGLGASSPEFETKVSDLVGKYNSADFNHRSTEFKNLLQSFADSGMLEGKVEVKQDDTGVWQIQTFKDNKVDTIDWDTIVDSGFLDTYARAQVAKTMPVDLQASQLIEEIREAAKASGLDEEDMLRATSANYDEENNVVIDTSKWNYKMVDAAKTSSSDNLKEAASNWADNQKTSRFNADREFDIEKDTVDQATQAASAAGVGLETFDKFNEKIQDTNKTLDLSEDGWKKYTATILKTSANVRDLKKAFDDNEKALAAPKGSLQYLDAVEKIDAELKTLMGINLKDVSEDQEAALTVVKDAANGSTEAIEKLNIAAAKKMVVGLAVDAKSENDLNQFIDDVSSKEVAIGTSLDTAGFADDLQNLIAMTGMSVEQAQELLNKLGYNPDITMKTLDWETYSNLSAGAQAKVRSELGVEEIANESAFAEAQSKHKLQIPIINAKETKKVKTQTTKLPDKDKKGGGGGGSKPQRTTKDPYYANTKQTESFNKALSQTAKLRERAYGENVNKYIDQEIAGQRELIKLYKEGQSIAQDQITTNKQKLMSIVGLTEADFDEFGNLSQKAYSKVIDKVDALKNAKKDEESTVLNEIFKNYENGINSFQEYGEKILDAQNTIITNINDKVQNSLDFATKTLEMENDRLSFLLEHVDDKGFNIANRMALTRQMVGNKQEKYKASTNAADQMLRDRGQTWEDLAVKEPGKRWWEKTDVNGNPLWDKESIETMSGYLKQMMDDYTELTKAIEEYINTLDVWAEHTNKEFDRLEKEIAFNNKTVSHYLDIVDVLGKDMLHITNDELAAMEKLKHETLEADLQNAKARENTMTKYYNDAKALYDQEKAKGEKADAGLLEEYRKKMEAARDEMISATEATQDKLIETLESAAQLFKNTVSREIEELQKQLFNGMTLEELNTAWERQEEINSRYVEDYQKIYELSKLNRQIEEQIDNSSNIKAKEKLLALEQELNSYAAQRGELTQHDIEYMQKLYDLRVAEIALEEAQNAKTTVRLTRDSEGNYGYTYTANEEDKGKAEQNYEDKLYALQDLNTKYVEESAKMQRQIQNNYFEWLANFDYTQENWEEKLAEGTQCFMDQMKFWSGELDLGLQQNQQLYYNDWMKYSETTGYKISANQDFKDNLHETIWGDLGIASSLSTGAGMYQAFANAIGTPGDKDTEGTGLLGDITKAHNKYKEAVDTALGEVGTSLGNYKTDMHKKLFDDNNSVQKQIWAFTDPKDGEIKKVETTAKNSLTEILDNLKNKLPDMKEEANKYVEQIDRFSTAWKQALTNYNAYASTTGGKTGSFAAPVKPVVSTPAASPSGPGNGSGGGGNNGNPKTGPRVEPTTSSKTPIWYEYTYDHPIRGSITTTSKQQVLNDLWNLYGKKVNAYESSNGSQKIVPKYKYKLQDGKWSNYFETLEEVQDKLLKTYSVWVQKYDTGGYTGEWGSDGRLAMLHQKELVLNANDTKNFLSAVDILRDITKAINLQAVAAAGNLGSPVAASISPTDQVIEQHVEITAEFPNATNHNEIEEAFRNLANVATQYTMRNQR